MVAKNRSNELRMVRVYEAAVEDVWDAWTDPDQVVQWWGPRGFTLTTHSKDLRAGGHWHYTMHGPDGTDYPNKTFYHVVETHKKLVYDHGGYDDRPPLFRVTALFEALPDGKTQLDMTMTLPSPEAAEETAKFIRRAGGHGTWDRLAEFLEKRTRGRDIFVIARSVAAPIEQVFEGWTDPQALAAWSPPAGFTMEFTSGTIEPGQRACWTMRNAAGQTMHGQMEYLKIEKPDTVVYLLRFTDAAGNIVCPPMKSHWPDTLLVTVTLTPEGPDQTRIRLLTEPQGPTTAEQLEAFLRERAGMTAGWADSFDQLEAQLVGV